MVRYRRYASSQSSLIARIRKVETVKLIQRRPYMTLNLVMKGIVSKENGEHLSQGAPIEVPVYVIWHDYIRADELGRISLTLKLGESMQVRIQKSFWISVRLIYTYIFWVKFDSILRILGGNVSSALASKVIILDKIGKVSNFLEVLLSLEESVSVMSSYPAPCWRRHMVHLYSFTPLPNL